MPGLGGGVPSPGGGVDGVQFGPGVGGVCLVRGGVPGPGCVPGWWGWWWYPSMH